MTANAQMPRFAGHGGGRPSGRLGAGVSAFGPGSVHSSCSQLLQASTSAGRRSLRPVHEPSGGRTFPRKRRWASGCRSERQPCLGHHQALGGVCGYDRSPWPSCLDQGSQRQSSSSPWSPQLARSDTSLVMATAGRSSRLGAGWCTRRQLRAPRTSGPMSRSTVSRRALPIRFLLACHGSTRTARCTRARDHRVSPTTTQYASSAWKLSCTRSRAAGRWARWYGSSAELTRRLAVGSG